MMVHRNPHQPRAMTVPQNMQRRGCIGRGCRGEGAGERLSMEGGAQHAKDMQGECAERWVDQGCRGMQRNAWACMARGIRAARARVVG